jgi:23S rRNA (adenine2503-C2)-methyltransferase
MVTFEYVLLSGVNDSPEQAGELAGLLQDLPCKVNLIPYNAVTGASFEKPSLAAQQRFKAIVAKAHVPVTIRNSKGRSIDAACGQLRRRAQARQAGTTNGSHLDAGT